MKTMAQYSFFILFIILLQAFGFDASSGSKADKEYELLVVTVATEETDGFKRFLRSTDKYDVNVKVVGMGEEWTGGDIVNWPGGGQKINLLKTALEEYKDRDDLILLFSDSYDVIFTTGAEEIIRKFQEMDANLVISAESSIWPDPTLASQYPMPEVGYPFVCSGLYMGYAPYFWSALTYRDIADKDDDQLFYTQLYLDSSRREEWKIKLDHVASLFMNLNGARDDVKLLFEGANSMLQNTKYRTVPAIIHGNGPSKLYLNQLGNYLANYWTQDKGCLACGEERIDLRTIEETEYPVVMLALFIEQQTPFIDEYFKNIEDFNYPKNKMHLYIHVNVMLHYHHAKNFAAKWENEYLSTTTVIPAYERSEGEARDEALNLCNEVECDYHFVIDSNVRLYNPEILKRLIEQNKPVIAPMVNIPDKLWSNFWGEVNLEGYYARSDDYVDIVKGNRKGVWNVPFVSTVYLIQGKRVRSPNTPSYVSAHMDPDMKICKDLRDQGIFMYVMNIYEAGRILNMDGVETSHLHNDLWQMSLNPKQWEEKYIHPGYWTAKDPDTDVELICPDVYLFPILSETFADHLVEEMENFGQWSNGGNQDTRLEGGYENVPTRDIHMNQIGYEKHWLYFLSHYVGPICEKLYWGYSGRHYAIMNFVVRYRPDEQPSLRPHHDSSTYTINIALNTQGKDYEGGGARFTRYNCSCIGLKKGWTLMHPGKLTHQHEGLPTTNGTRVVYLHDHVNQCPNNVVLPEILKSIPKSSKLPKVRHRWNINEEIASWLTSFNKHEEWLSTTLKIRPQTGSIFLYNRKRVKFRHDGFVWKKRKERNSTREDHMKLKVKGEECLYGGYVHSAIVPTFHRRSYWLLQNPDIVLVHYLNDWQPHESKGGSEDSLLFNPALDGKQWKAEDLLAQIQPMFVGLKLRVNGSTESITGSASLEALVQYMLAEQAKAGHLTNHVTNESGSNSTCSCQKSKGRRRNSTSKNEGESNHKASSSSHQNDPEIQPTFTLEPQRPTPSQNKVVPSNIFINCLEQSEHSSPQAVHSSSQPPSACHTVLTSSVPTSSLPGGPHPAHTILPNRTHSDALVFQTSSITARHPGQFSSTSAISTQLNSQLQPAATPSGEAQYNSVSYNPPRVTTEESQELVKLVEANPHLRTARNRFRNQKPPETGVRLPLEVMDILQLNVVNGRPPGHPNQMTTALQPGQTIPPFQNIPVNNALPLGHQQMDAMVKTGHPIAKGSHNASEVSLSGCHMSNATLPSTSMDTSPIITMATSSQSQSNLISISQMHSSIRMNNMAPLDTTTTPSGSSKETASATTVSHSHTPAMPPMSQMQGMRTRGPSHVQSSYQPNLKEHSDSENMDTFPSSLGIDFDPFDILKNTLNLAEIDQELLRRSGIVETNGTDVMMDIQSSGNHSNQVLPGRLSKDSGHGSVDSSEEALNARGESSSSASLLEIADFSPEWSYPEGGIKVLVAGPWSTSSAEYSCVFDSFAVPASLIQPGLLRCFCPAHEKGLVPLHVTCNGSVISKSVLFEYKARRAAKTQQDSTKQQQQQEWIELDDKQFQMALLETLEQIERRLCHGSPQVTQQGTSGLCNSHLSFEERVVIICEKLMQITPPDGLVLTRDQIPRGMTLLHHAAALGYANLIKTLRKWRELRGCLIMELEINPLNIDDHSCTPIMWACALGHKDAALRLYEWNPKCLRMSDRLHRLPIGMSRARGHISLADCLEKMDHQNSNQSAQNSQISQPIEIPTSLSQLPSFMISSPANKTPDSSSRNDFSPAGNENISPSSGVLSQLSVSPRSQGGSSPQSHPSPRMSPVGTSDTSEGSIPTSLYDDLQALLDMDREMDLPPGQGGMFGGSGLFKVPPPPPTPSTSSMSGSADTNRPSTSRKGKPDGFSGARESAWEELDRKRAENIALSLEKLKKMFAQDSGDDIMEEAQKPASKEQYLTLAEQILDALPARIKEDETSMNVDDINFGPAPFFAPLSVDIDEEIEEVNDYRSEDIDSPASTYTTTDSSCMPSPPNLTLDEDGQLSNWFDFFPSGLIDGTTLGGFSLLTLSDEEQRQLYKAALVIQNAFRQYKGRQQQKQQELEAAVIIQSYYRRYKDYVGYLQMSQAARVIQNRFRSYKNYRQFQKSRKAAIIIQSRFRSYRANKQFRKSRNAAILIQQRFRDKRMARLKREQDAARKIQRFIRHYQNRLKS